MNTFILLALILIMFYLFSCYIIQKEEPNKLQSSLKTSKSETKKVMINPTTCIMYQHEDGRNEDLCYDQDHIDNCIGGIKNLSKYLKTKKCII
jgi:hypothetical protein